MAFEGQTFTTFEKSSPNSQVLFQETESSPVNAGKIFEIFQHSNISTNGTRSFQVYMCIRSLAQHTSEHDDIQIKDQQYRALGGRVFIDTLSTDITVIKLEQIVSHFFCCPCVLSKDTGRRIILTFPVSDLNQCVSSCHPLFNLIDHLVWWKVGTGR